jgi:hypothetical protein
MDSVARWYEISLVASTNAQLYTKIQAEGLSVSYPNGEPEWMPLYIMQKTLKPFILW